MLIATFSVDRLNFAVNRSSSSMGVEPEVRRVPIKTTIKRLPPHSEIFDITVLFIAIFE